MSPMRLKKLHSNESGMALVTALLILVALTLLAVTAMTNTTINTMIAGNDYQSQQKFYATEGAEELALSALPDLISGLAVCHHDSYGNPIPPITCNDQKGSPITTLDQLLKYDGDGDNQPDGKIRALLNSYLNPQPPRTSSANTAPLLPMILLNIQ